MNTYDVEGGRADPATGKQRRREETRRKLMYGGTIFGSAFLLFAVQPLISKIILPWFGGVAAVWTVCLLFFQVTLLLGYLYAHTIHRKFRPQTQGRIHAAFLAASLVALPILPKNSWKPTGPGAPALHILLLLTLTVGLPYLMLSSTSPLLQAWYARGGRAAPYRFYALSNVGSMLALLTYPVLAEPQLTSTQQALAWSTAYAAMAVWCAALALGACQDSSPVAAADDSGVAPLFLSRPDRKTKALWVALAACGSALLLGVTNHISQNIASVPFLWVLPLGVYLFSFILCFDRRAWYRRALFLRLLGVALGGMAYGLAPSFMSLPVKVLVPLYCAGLLVCCMFCHGELARLKPHPAHLTSFYLLCSLGGAGGAALVALVAPRIFSGYYELQTALGTCALLVLVVQYRDRSGVLDNKAWQPAGLVLVGLVVALLTNLVINAREQARTARLSVRNFYGVLRVIDHLGPGTISAQAEHDEPAAASPAYRSLVNGTIDHGLQFLAPELRRQPTSYYAVNSGIGRLLHASGGHGALRVGVIGLGAGTLAAYGHTGDQYTFYEINPLDVQMARTQFTFLADSEAHVDIVLGDARLSLEGEPPQQFDILAVDAFSSDSIPVHLLTREAFTLYFRHLKPEGVLGLHISNQYLNLQPVVEAAADALGREAVLIHNDDDRARAVYQAFWILIGDKKRSSGMAEIEREGTVLRAGSNRYLWTDNYSSLFRILK